MIHPVEELTKRFLRNEHPIVSRKLPDQLQKLRVPAKQRFTMGLCRTVAK